MSSKPPTHRLAVITLEVLFLAVFWLFVFSASFFLRNTIVPRSTLNLIPEMLNLPSGVAQFKATDGAKIQGWKIPSDPGRPWIILCHGFGTNRSDVLDIAAGLHAKHFNVLLFDFRGHGESAGRTTSFGYREQRDLEGALAFLGGQPEVEARPYGLYGISMGGAVGLMVAARDERIGAVAADSPYTNLESTIGDHIRILYRYVPRYPFLWFVSTTYRLRFGGWPRYVSPLKSVSKISPRPILLIHGGQDNRMPLAGTKTMFEAASEPKELWVVKDAGHMGAYALNPAGYINRLADFFESSLSPVSEGVRPH